TAQAGDPRRDATHGGRRHAAQGASDLQHHFEQAQLLRRQGLAGGRGHRGAVSPCPVRYTPPPMTHLAPVTLPDPLVVAPPDALPAGQSLTREEGPRLFDAPLLDLGMLADAFAQDRHDDRVYFTVNRQLNPTNVCVLSCRFCDYAKKPGDPAAYTMTEAEIKA